jgi:asparagine synthase (glutamine-hydrolysing)
MCGIAGLAGWADRGTIERMTACLAHRGPDDTGIHIEPEAGIALGHRRLSILDLSPAGHQPMTVGDGALILCYNGEIYNYRELRAGLAADGVQFRSQTDSEVILHLYARDGADCVRQLNGIFAFAIWDRRQRRLLLARDHFGTKPLYYVERGGRLAFASEAKALFEVPGLSPDIDLDSLNLFLTFLWTPDPQTAFAGVYKLPAGHLAEWQDGRLSIRRYWDLAYPPAASRPAPADPAALAGEFRARFGAAVERQMVSDVPLGAFLSAGLDSSAIVYEMQQRSREPVRTYTISFAGRHAQGDVTLDDASVAADTAKAFGCRHTPIVVEPDVAGLLPTLAWHMDEPTADPAIILAYLVNREARREVTVLLSGIGGDEVLGGYRKYVAAMDARRYQKLPAALRAHVLDPAFRHAPATPGTPWAGYGRLLRKWGRSASLPPRAQFIENGTYMSAVDRRALLRPDVRERIAIDSATRFHEAAFDRVAGADWLHQMMYVDAKIFMASLNLTYNDKMSMASGVEVRVPFLDWELAEWLATAVPPEAKLAGRTTKALLRAAYRDRLPAAVLEAPKAGFGAPIGRWLMDDLREMVDDLLSPERVRRRGLFEPAVVEAWIREQRAGRIERAWNVWQLLTWELWMTAFFDRRAAAAPLTAAAAGGVT